MDWSGQTTVYGYDAAHRLVTATLPNGVQTLYTYDAANRLTRLVHTRNGGSEVLAEYAFTLDKVGNRLAVTETLLYPGAGGLASALPPTNAGDVALFATGQYTPTFTGGRGPGLSAPIAVASALLRPDTNIRANDQHSIAQAESRANLAQPRALEIDLRADQNMPSNLRYVTVDSAAGFPTAGVLDNFDRSNGTIGSNWSGTTSGYSIASNRLDVGTGGNIFWNGSSFGADQEAFVTLTNVDPSGTEQDLLLKSQSSTSYMAGVLEVWYDAAGSQVQVWTYTSAQSWVQRGANIPVMFANGDQFGARAKADGTVEVYRNGVLLATRDVTAWPYYANGGYVELWFANAANSVLDDFGGGAVQASVTAAFTATPVAGTAPALNITYSSHKFPVRWFSFLARGINFFRTRPSVV